MLYTAFAFGLISSMHCVGMCGPIAMMLPVDNHNQAKKVTQIMSYHLGRIFSYAAIGFIFGLLGRGFFMAGFQQKLSIAVGILIVATVLIPSTIFNKYNFSKPVFGFISKIKTALGSQFRNKSYQSLFTIGLLNGFLPCGMVYVALFGALAMQSPVLGSFYMMLFGVGTIPLMSLVVILHTTFSISVRNKIQKMIPKATVIIGLLFIARGLGLGIDYVSPSDINLYVQQTPTCK